MASRRSVKRLWKNFRKKAGEKFIFLHRDEYEKLFDKAVKYPVVLRKKANNLDELLSSTEINKLNNAAALIDRLSAELSLVKMT